MIGWHTANHTVIAIEALKELKFDSGCGGVQDRQLCLQCTMTFSVSFLTMRYANGTVQNLVLWNLLTDIKA